ncbi:DUF6924 domain-containing protein [Saccharopolyspora gloriosae]|uniref:DUF6924 domain-containing protein n=1 Tax=Saccharopolyspora gloriosae TaxID=455344 RepID=UPI001FB6C24C|nr:hypothetical protein [Saccharopolyspora gloriosae]
MTTGNSYALVLRPGEQLSRRAVGCPTGEYSVVHQHDGNVVVYRNADSFPVWATGTNFQSSVGWHTPARFDTAAYGKPGRLTLEEDGDLVVYSPDGARRWSSDTAGEPVASLMIHDWGKLVLKDHEGYVVWQTERAPKRWDGWNNVADGRRLRRGQCLRNASLVSDNGEYAFVVGGGDADYLCRTDGPILWVVFHQTGDGYELTTEGKLLSRRPDGLPHHPYSLMGGDSPSPDALLVSEMLVTDDGRLVLVDEDGAIMWTMRPEQESEAETPEPARREIPAAPAGIPPLPVTESVPVVRTDFSDDAAWVAAAARATATYWDGDLSASANVTSVNDARYAGLTPEQLVALVPEDADWAVLIVADELTMTSPEHHLCVVNLDEDGLGETQRATAPAMVEMEVNLSLANMDWEDFSDGSEDHVIEAMNLH